MIIEYNEWRAAQQSHKLSFKDRGIWFVGGDFNATPDSDEIQKIQHMNFMDLCPQKGKGSKRAKTGHTPSITVDYIFAGPQYYAFDPEIVKKGLLKKEPIYTIDPESSDHYPIMACFSLT